MDETTSHEEHTFWDRERDFDATRSYVRNFPEAVCKRTSIDQFGHFFSADFHVDIMYILPSCIFFSSIEIFEEKDFGKKLGITRAKHAVLRLDCLIFDRFRVFGARRDL